MKRWIVAITLGLGLTAMAGSLWAQYPNRPIKLVVPFPPGGPNDLIGRLVGQKIAHALGQPVILENRAGAGGTIGAESVAKSAPDGYTLLLGTTGTLAIAPSLYPNPGYDPRTSFAPVSTLTSAQFLIAVNVAVPARSLQELIELARSKPASLAYGAGGIPLHIAGEMFKKEAAVDLVHVPYKGAAPAITDLVAGRVHVIFEQLPALQPHIRSGKIRALAVAGPRRLSQLPEVPTAAEAGLPGYEIVVWSGLLAPAGTPADALVRLSAETRRALASSEVRDAFATLGVEPAGNAPEDFAALIRKDGLKWSEAVKRSGAKLD